MLSCGIMWGRQAIDKMKYIPPFPMKKLSLIVLLLISSLSAFAKEQEEASDEISVNEALKSCVGGSPQPSIKSIKTTDLKELDEISVDEALRNRIGCPPTSKAPGQKEGDFKYVLDGMVIDKNDFGDIAINIDVNDIKYMELITTNTYYDYIFIGTKKGSRLSKQIPKTMKELGISEYKYRGYKYTIDEKGCKYRRERMYK